MILLVIIQYPVLSAALATEVANGCNAKNTIVWKNSSKVPPAITCLGRQRVGAGKSYEWFFIYGALTKP